MTTRKAEDTRTVSAWRSLVRLRAFLVPHWRAVGLALVLMMAEAAIDLLKPWPLKLTLDVILKRDALAGSTLSLLVAISLLIVALAVFEGLFAYLAALHLNRAAERWCSSCAQRSSTTSTASRCSSTTIVPLAT